MEHLKKISSDIIQNLDKVLPKHVHCVFVLVDVESKEMCTSSDLSDASATRVLQEAVKTMENPDESCDIMPSVDTKLTN